MRLVSCLSILAAGAVSVLTGCDANQLYMGSRTVVGINAAVNTNLNDGWLIVGYDRTFATAIPRSVSEPVKDQTGRTTGQKQESMTAMACSSLAVNGVTVKHFKESVATGEAASRFAEGLSTVNAKPMKDFFDCFRNKGGNPDNSAVAAQGASGE